MICTPKLGHPKRSAFLRITYEQKIQIYNERKQGKTISYLSQKYNYDISNLKYLVELIDIHGFKILRKNKNNYYSSQFKINAINEVLLNNKSIKSVSLNKGLLTQSILISWIHKFKNNDYTVIEKKRGITSMTKKKESIKNPETELARLRKGNEYLKAELEYSKKLKAVVQKRINQQQKKK